MKKTLFLLSALTLSLSAKEDNWVLNNSFVFYGDFAYFKREGAHKHKLVIDNSTTLTCNCRFPSCGTKHLAHQFGFEPGFKVGATYMTHHTAWDVSYLWLHPWKSECSKSGSGSIIFSVSNPGITTDFDGADRGEAEYHSQFQNGELNFFRYLSARHSDRFYSAWMAGLRYINLRESVDVSFEKGSNRSSYQVHTTNHIPTLQVGADIAWNPTSTLSWDLLLKVGLGFDIGEQNTFLGDINNTVIVRDYEKSGFSFPLVTEAGIILSYQPLSCLNLHVAYQMIYLNGVALAPDQIVKSSNHGPYYNADGAPLIHGLTAGLGWSF